MNWRKSSKRQSSFSTQLILHILFYYYYYFLCLSMVFIHRSIESNKQWLYSLLINSNVISRKIVFEELRIREIESQIC